MSISYPPILPRQSIINPHNVVELTLNNINSNIHNEYKNQIFQYIIKTKEPNKVYMLKDKNNIYGHSSFPQIDNNSYLNEYKNRNCNYIFTIKYAGNIAFDNLGKLKFWDNSSGHYKPDAKDSLHIGLDISKFKCYNKKITWADKVTINK